MATVAVILPVYGRHEQTLVNAARMVAAAGAVDALWVAVGGATEDATIDALVDTYDWVGACGPAERYTYWQALAKGQDAALAWPDRTGEPSILCAVANDVWAGERWLELGLSAYAARFPDGEGLMGFAGDGHPVTHSCHFLIGRRLLAHLGGWPVHYRHNFGDTELCRRAQALGRYAKATRAILEHRHPIITGAPDDEVYQAGRAGWTQDEALYYARLARGWTA